MMGEEDGVLKKDLICESAHRFPVEFCRGENGVRVETILPHVEDGAVMVVSTPTVWSMYGRTLAAGLAAAGLDTSSHVMPLGEQRKTMTAVQAVCERAHDSKIGRRGTLLALGGGVCSDVVAFAASMVRRGVNHVRVPTTLIGQVDAGIGIKCGVNLASSKNYLGAFRPPRAAIIAPSMLATLPASRIIEGLAEIVKMALVRDSSLFATLEMHGFALIERRFQAPASVADSVICQSIALMLEELEADVFETGSLARLVDMGHTFSPAIEAASGYTIPHGMAVAIDMAASALLAVRLGLCDQDVADRLIALLLTLELPVWTPAFTPALFTAAIHHATLHRNGKLNLVVPTSIGSGAFVESADVLDSTVAHAVLAELQCLAKRAGVPVARSA